MKKNNSKKWIKTITITTAVLVFAAGAVSQQVQLIQIKIVLIQ